MTKYIVNGLVTISVNMLVEADSIEDAKEQAEGNGSMMRLCWECAEGASGHRNGYHWNEWRTSGDLDGEPEVQGVEDFE